MFDIVRNPRTYTNYQQLCKAAAGAASMVKLVTGICNNATFLVMAEAMERLAAHPLYRGRVKHLFTDAIKEWKRYEGNLLYATTNRFFHLDDLDEVTRAKFADITDREYFEFWQGCGGRAYMKTRPLITSLANKFKLSFERDGYQQAGTLSWVMTAAVCLHMSVKMWQMSIETASESVGLPKDLLQRLFVSLSVQRPKEAWDFALQALEPRIKGDICDNERNIALGITQLYDAWSSGDGLFGSAAEAIGDYSEVFSGKKTMKQIKREMFDMKHDVESQVEEQNRERIIGNKI